MQNPTPETTSTKITIVCKTCGKEFQEWACHVKKRKRLFCSMDCRWPNPVSIACEHCGKSFHVSPERLKRSYNPKFCSKGCAGAFRATPIDRFWNFVDKNGPIPAHRPELGPCWIWMRGRDTAGYGVVSLKTGCDRAHRVAFELTNGAIREGMNILHKCDWRSCCRPDHLFEGTDADNARDKVEKGRHSFGEKRYNHIFTEQTVRIIRSEKGLTLKQLAVKYGASPSAISAIRLRRTWKHVN